MDPSTGAFDRSWRPKINQLPAGSIDPYTGSTVACPPRCKPSVTSLAVATSGDLYVGGHFGLVNGSNRNNAGEVSATDGSMAMPWDPNIFVAAPTNPRQHNYVYGIAVSPVTSLPPEPGVPLR